MKNRSMSAALWQAAILAQLATTSVATADETESSIQAVAYDSPAGRVSDRHVETKGKGHSSLISRRMVLYAIKKKKDRDESTLKGPKHHAETASSSLPAAATIQDEDSEDDQASLPYYDGHDHRAVGDAAGNHPPPRRPHGVLFSTSAARKEESTARDRDAGSQPLGNHAIFAEDDHDHGRDGDGDGVAATPQRKDSDDHEDLIVHNAEDGDDRALPMAKVEVTVAVNHKNIIARMVSLPPASIQPIPGASTTTTPSSSQPPLSYKGAPSLRGTQPSHATPSAARKDKVTFAGSSSNAQSSSKNLKLKLDDSNDQLSKIAEFSTILSSSNYSSNPNVKAAIGALMRNEANDLCFTGTDTYVTEKCNGHCCVIDDGDGDDDDNRVCKWRGNATVCVGSCQGDKACHNLETHATILPFSCSGEKACYELGYYSSKDEDHHDGPSWSQSAPTTSVAVGPKACNEEKACSKAGRKAEAVHAGYASCTGFAACSKLGDSTDGFVSIADYACDGAQSCDSMDATESIAVGTKACFDGEACFSVGSDHQPRAVSIGEASCVGFDSCYGVGHDVTSSYTVTIDDGSCVGNYACHKLGRFVRNGNVSVGHGACLGERSCFEVASRSYHDHVGGQNSAGGSASVGDESCTDAYICYKFGHDLDNGGSVSITSNACTSTDTDVCGTKESVGGDAACGGGRCNKGDSFILSSSTNVVSDCTQFCVDSNIAP